MFEEPFRWMEAIATRHSYVREKLAKGQPVFAVPYVEGVLLFGCSPQPGKIFEVYDRIAMGGMGHPADIEKMRMTLLDMAHLEGFNRSAEDVTVARLLQFGIAPALKQNFEEVMRAPYLLQLILAELDSENRPHIYRLNYDGYWESLPKGGALSGDDKAMERLDQEIAKTPFATFSLEKALEELCRLWEAGRKQTETQEAVSEEDALPKTMAEVFDRWNVEAAVLCAGIKRKAVYRPVTEQEMETLKRAVSKK